MRPVSFASVTAVVLVSLISCGSGESGPDPMGPTASSCSAAPVPVAWFRDLGNAGGASDMAIRLGAAPGSTCTSQIRVMVAPEGGVPADAAAALAVPADRALPLATDFGGGVIDFGAPGVDVTGSPIIEGVPYTLVVVAAGSDLPTLITTTSTLTLQNADLVRTISPQIDAGSGGLETDAAGNIYTADFGETLQGPPGDRIHRVTPAGEVSVFATGFIGASGNDRAENGDLFQSSIQGGSIQRVTPEGSVSTFATGLSAPVGIVALPGDTLLVAGCGDQTVQRVAPDGTTSTFAASDEFSCPNGITEAPDGNYYIANFSNGRVHRVKPTGEVSLLWTVPSGNAGHILWGLGALWVVDRGGNRLYRLTLAGEVTPVAGSGVRGIEDGPALQATLSLTNDVAFSPDSTRLYFNDVANTTSPQNELTPVLVRALIFARDEG